MLPGSRWNAFDQEQSSGQCLGADSERFSVLGRTIPLPRLLDGWKFNNHYRLGRPVALDFFDSAAADYIMATVVFDGSLR